MIRNAKSPAPTAALLPVESRISLWLAVSVIVAAGFFAYGNSFTAPFVFDDRPSIVENPTIRRLATAFFPPTDIGSSVRGRPLINFSFALNYAAGGLDVRGYHVVNLLIHLAAALTLYGLAWRTLRRGPVRVRFGAVAQPVALVATVMWTVHPLLTESVTCVVQRTESLASLFYLLTLYAFVRATEPGGSSRWLIGSVGACLVGLTAKEILATAPLLVLLYDDVFVSEGVRDAWRRRRGYYCALGATWLPLGLLMLGAQGRGGTVGFGYGVAWWEYALTQCRAVILYLRLSVVPYPLVIDYGMELTSRFAAVWPQALLLSALVAATAWAMWRRRAAGFLGACFFVILAPSSSIVPLTTQTIAEHRMYLPLAAFVLLVVGGGYAWLGRRSLPFFWAWAVALTVGTVLRNADYRSELAIWSDAAAHAPLNPRAHYNLGVTLLDLGRLTEAEGELREALRLAPNYGDALLNLGQLLVTNKRPREAVDALEAALRLRPDSARAHFLLATALSADGHLADVLAHYETAVRLKPDFALAQSGLGSTLAAAGRVPEAIGPLEAAARLQPENVATQTNLASALAMLGRGPEAIGHFETALRLQPDSAETHFNFGLLLAQTGDLARAQQQWERALELKPDYPDARVSLERVRAYLRATPGAR